MIAWFAHPWLLLLLLLVPPLVWLRYRSGARAKIRFSDGRALAALPPSLAIRLRWILPALFAIGLACLVIVIARPRKGSDESIVRTESVDIVLCVDLSPSMRSLDFSTSRERINRLDAVKRVVETFVKSREHDRIAIVGFAGLPYSVAPLTLDHGWLIKRMTDLNPGDLGDRTAIGSGIASSVNRLRDSKAKSKLIILLTDGSNNAGEISPQNAAQAAKALGIKIYTVGAAREGQVPYPVQTPWGEQMQMVQSDVDEDLLKDIAQTTGALFFRAQDFEQLKKIYEQIDKMEKTAVEVEQYTRFEERFQPWLCAALLCLCLEKILSLTRLGRTP